MKNKVKNFEIDHFGLTKQTSGGGAAGFGNPTASVDANVGTPSVVVTASGSDKEKVFDFAFHNLKGEKGDKGDKGDTGEIYIQKSTMPTASATELGNIHQYIGETTSSYTNGYFYKCVYDSSTQNYSWKLINVQGNITQEHVTIKLNSSDGLLTVSGINVNVAINGGTTVQLTTDSNGECQTVVPYGYRYTVSVPSQTGYQQVVDRVEIASTNEKFINVTYYKSISGTCDITVTASIYDPSFVSGKTVTLILSDGSTPSGTFDANGIAAINNIPQGLTGYTQCQYISGFQTPARVDFSTSYSSLGLTVSYRSQGSGIWMIKEDGTQVDPDAWVSTDTCVAILVATSTLLEKGYPFYIKPSDLASTMGSGQWASANVLFPNVPYDSATDYNGVSNTQNMITDAESLSVTTTSANWATQQSFTLSGNVKYGYMGTKKQWEEVAANRYIISECVSKAGYTQTFLSRNIWTSTQFNATFAWYWSSGSFSNSGSYGKDYSYYVVPFFAI